MTTRRSFFASLALIGAGAATAPGIFIPKFEPVWWKPDKFVLTREKLTELTTALRIRDHTGAWVWIRCDESGQLVCEKLPMEQQDLYL